jgi:hypothetical protein
MEKSSEFMTIFSELVCTDTDFFGVLVSLTVIFKNIGSELWEKVLNL